MPKVLVIDDEEAQLDYAAMVFELAGFKVDKASGGQQGLDFMAAGRPDLIFCDAMMPEMDGFEFLDRVRADPANSSIPFIFATAMRFGGARTEAKQRGAQEYIVKPYKAEALVATARRLLKLPDA